MQYEFWYDLKKQTQAHQGRQTVAAWATRAASARDLAAAALFHILNMTFPERRR